MKSRLLLGCSLLLMVLVTGASLVAAQEASSCEIVHLFNAWAPASPDGAPNGVIYGLLTNLSDQADTLISATTDAAEVVELHQMVIGDGDVMQMQPIEGGITVEAQSYRELKPKGLHLMLINLTRALAAGENLDLTLNFERIGEVTITVPIIDAANTGNAMSDKSAGMEPTVTSGETGTMMATTAAPAGMMWPEACAKMHVVGGWARPAGPGMPTSAAYLLLVNLTAQEDTLISVSTSAVITVELHEMTMGSGDVMQMRPIEGGIVIPADGAVILQPGGKHIMLIGLTQELEAGTTIDLTLTFEHSGKMNITVPVQKPAE